MSQDDSNISRDNAQNNLESTPDHIRARTEDYFDDAGTASTYAVATAVPVAFPDASEIHQMRKCELEALLDVNNVDYSERDNIAELQQLAIRTSETVAQRLRQRDRDRQAASDRRHQQYERSENSPSTPDELRALR